MRIITLLLLFAGQCMSQEIVIDAAGAEPGSYYYRVDVADDGTVKATRLENVVRLADGEPGPGPPPRDPPDDPAPETLSQRVARLANQVSDPNRKKTAAALAVIYDGVAEVSGQLTRASQILEAVNILYGPTIRAAQAEPLWARWKSEVDALLVQYSIDKLPNALRAVAKGLKSL